MSFITDLINCVFGRVLVLVSGNPLPLYKTFCAVFYHLYNLKIEKNDHGGVLLLVKTLFHWCFSRFLNCTNGSKLGKASYMPWQLEAES